jgi:hypothetical protein
MRNVGLKAEQMGLAALAAGVGWYAVLMRPILTASAFGPICGHHGLVGPHCPACYAALSLAVAGLGLVASSSAGGRAKVPARVRARSSQPRR